MKKTVIIVASVLVALVIFGSGILFAQSQFVRAAGLPAVFANGGMTLAPGASAGVGGRGGMGQIHTYVEQAMADKLGMTLADFQAAEDKGQTWSQIAIAKGTAQADVPALLAEVYKTAFDKAVKDGVLTQAQADSMLQMMTTNGFAEGWGMMGGRGRGGSGPMQAYVEQALADKLGMTLADLQAAEAQGQTWSQIAIARGTAAADVTALLTEVHKTAFTKAVTDGVLTQAQADAMLQNMTANGFNFGNCPSGSGGGMMGRGFDGQGRRGGRGGMMGGWGQQNQQAQPAQPTTPAPTGTSTQG